MCSEPETGPQPNVLRGPVPLVTPYGPLLFTELALPSGERYQVFSRGEVSGSQAVSLRLVHLPPSISGATPPDWERGLRRTASARRAVLLGFTRSAGQPVEPGPLPSSLPTVLRFLGIPAVIWCSAPPAAAALRAAGVRALLPQEAGRRRPPWVGHSQPRRRGRRPGEC